jgi:hypothetical protein
MPEEQIGDMVLVRRAGKDTDILPAEMIACTSRAAAERHFCMIV